MSKNIKVFIYITISISTLIFLLISFVSIKASFGGLNLNIFGERISDELKLNYSFDTDVENIVLKRSSEKGFYLEIEKIQIKNQRSFLDITKNYYILYLIFLGMSFYKVNFL